VDSAAGPREIAAGEFVLPQEFRELEPWTQAWVLPDSVARAEKRQSTDYAEIKRFYDAVAPHASRALDALAQQPLGGMDPANERLLKLLLALAEIAPAVEWYQQTKVIDGFPADRFALVEQLADNVAQG
jgi:hypothetical protein